MKKRSSLVLTGLLVLALLTMAVGCQPTPTETAEPPTEEASPTEAPPQEALISIAGSTTVQPLAEALAEAFIAGNPNVQIDVQGGGSSVGVKSAGEGTVDIGAASREVKQSELDEYTNLQIHTIARDGIAIAVHPDVGVDELTTEQVRQIFAGEITNWSDVGGADAAIVVVSREEGSGTRSAFEELVMGDEAVIVDTAILQPSNGAVRTTVSTTPDSIGFLSFGYLDESVKALTIEGVEATEANAASGEYPVVRPLNMMTDGDPEGVVKDFLDFILGGEGQAIVSEEGYISVSGAAMTEDEGEEEEPEEEAMSGQISVAGSTTVQPLAEALADVFTTENPDVEIDIQGGGSSVGVKSAGEGTVDIGNASREVKQSELDEYPNLNIYTVARDGIAIAVHPDVGVDELTTEQVRQIFAGEITNWSDVGGADVTIVVVAREEGSGTRAAFEELVMGDDAVIVDTAILLPSNGAVRTTVSTTPDSVGFLSFGYLDESVKALTIDGVEATEANAASGEYPVVRPLNMMTDGEPEGVVKAFLDFILSDDGQAIVSDEGYIAVGGAATEMGDVPTGLSGQIGVAGSTTVQPLAEALADVFTGYNPDVEIDIQGGGSSVGVKSAGEGTVDIGNASREVKQSELDEYPNLNIYTIARDGIAIAVHPDVGVDELTTEQVRQIFAGEIINWSEVGGADATIVVVAREEGSGTRAAFEELVMGDDAVIADTAILLPSNGAVRTTVSTTPDSVGFLSFGYLDESVKALTIDGVEATEANAGSGEYPVVRPLNMMTDGEPEGVVKAFLDFILSSEGQAQVAEEGYIPVQ